MTTQLTFQNVALTTISRNNQTYISASDLANALQYADSRAITKIYTRNQDEFTPDMSLVVNLTTKGYGNGNSEKEQRIFSLRGCHLVAMFSRTPVAKEFRKWVLDILDKEVSQNVEEIRPLEPTYHREHTQTEMLCFASLWFSLYNCRDTLEQVSEPLMALGARLGSTAYTHATEYRNTLGLLQRILVKMLDGIETEEPHYRKALTTLRGYQPRGLARIAKR